MNLVPDSPQHQVRIPCGSDQQVTPLCFLHRTENLWNRSERFKLNGLSREPPNDLRLETRGQCGSLESMKYHITLVESEEGFAVWCDDLPGCCSQGANKKEALENIRIAIQEYLDVQPEIEARFAKEAWPHRVLMADFPAGSSIIPNPVNRIASFSVRDHHFFPGFPQMAWPMLDWVLATRYATIAAPPSAERAIVVYGAGESQLLPVMNDNVARFPQLKLFSLPSFMPEGGRRIELGVRGDPSLLDAAIAHLVAGVEAGGFRWEPLVPRESGRTP